jgi:hypothetical protein
MDEVKELIVEREDQYGPSWAAHGQCLAPVTPLVEKMSRQYPPIVWPWHAIFNKLLRTLTSPLKRDHWIDIQGYAQLVIDMIDEITEKEVEDKRGKVTEKTRILRG